MLVIFLFFCSWGILMYINWIYYTRCSNAVKFTHEGKVGIKLYVVPTPSWGKLDGSHQKFDVDQSTTIENGKKEDKPTSETSYDRKDYHGQSNGCYQNQSLDDEPRTPNKTEAPRTEDMEEQSHSPEETTVWIRCDVYDTGIGIPGMLYAVIVFLNQCLNGACFVCLVVCFHIVLCFDGYFTFG